MSQLRKRRDVLKLSVLAAGALPTACYRAAIDPPTLSEDDSAPYFPQSVASGDPRPDSIVLWARVEDARRPQEDAELELVMALDAELTQPVGLTSDATILITAADADHCLSVRVGGLTPATTYYYRFRYRALEGIAESRVGQTRTAPAVDSTDPVTFAVICCQDYGGKYFHAARHISQQEVDFVLHLGDYIYETAGDPTFQSSSKARSVVFSAPDEALTLGSGDATFLAAQSLSNYRDLYKLYRGDPDLQALHERHPMIAMWDDHEFSDDCHGDVATYLDGRADETEPTRRAAADQAWSEFMPVDYTPADDPNTDPGRRADKLDKTADFPGNFLIYRSYVFGQHLELFLTDLRRFRPDHLVPEDAPPGAVFLTADEVKKNLDPAPPDLVPYVDIASFGGGAYLQAFTDNAEALDITVDSLTGDFSAVWINSALASLTDVKGLPDPIDVTDASLELGYAYHCLLKTKQFTRIGARYVVAVRPFEALAQKRWLASKQQSERLMGDDQRAWFLEGVQNSQRTFKIWGSEVAFQSRHIDLTGFTLAPPELQTLISVSAEDWDGFPNERRALLKELASAGNVVILSGDLHCCFAGTPYLETDENTRLIELTTSSVSSTTWLDSIQGSLSSDPTLPMNVGLLVQNIGAFLTDTKNRPNPHLAFQDLADNGYSIIAVGPDDVTMTVRSISTKNVAIAPNKLRQPLDDLFSTERFRTKRDSAELEREVDGTFLTWSRKDMAFQ